MNSNTLLQTFLLALAASCCIRPASTLAQAQNLMNPALTELGYIPLPDLGFGTYSRDGNAVRREIQIKVTGTAPNPATTGPASRRIRTRARPR